MNKDQLGRLRKAGVSLGRIIVGGVVWFGGIKLIVNLLLKISKEQPFSQDEILTLHCIVGFFYPIAIGILANSLCYFLTWVFSGEAIDMFTYYDRFKKDKS